MISSTAKPGSEDEGIGDAMDFHKPLNGTSSKFNKNMKITNRKKTAFKIAANQHDTDTLGIGMSVDIHDAETSSGVSSRSASNSPILQLTMRSNNHLSEEPTSNKNQNDSDSDIETTSWDKRMGNVAPRYNSRDTSPEADESSKTLELEMDVTSKKPQTRYQTRLSAKKSKFSTPEKICTVKNSGKMDLDISISQKRRKSSLRGCDSTDEDNCPSMEKKSSNLRKKRRLNSRAASIDDFFDLQVNSSDNSMDKFQNTSNKSLKPSNGFAIIQSPVNSISVDNNSANEPPEFIEYEMLDEEMDAIAPVEMMKSPEPLKTKTFRPESPIERPTSPSEFEAFDLGAPVEDVDVGWNTDDDFSDGEVPPEVRSTRVVKQNNPPTSVNIRNNNPPIIVSTKANNPATTVTIMRNNSPPPLIWTRSPSPPRNTSRRGRNSRRSRNSKKKPSNRYSRSTWPAKKTSNTSVTTPQTLEAVWSNLASTSRGIKNDNQNPLTNFIGMPLAPVKKYDSDVNHSDTEESDDSNSGDSDDERDGYPYYHPDKIKPEEKPALNDAFHPDWLEYRLPKSKGKRRYGEKTFHEGQATVSAIMDIHQQLQKKPADEAKVTAPREMRVKLLDHQEHALAWMRWRESARPAGGILADDMGLGKTITAIALIMNSLDDECRQTGADGRKNPGGTLIVCPANLIPQWEQEIQLKGNIPDVDIYHTQHKENRIDKLRQNQVVITSYDTLANNSKTREKILFKIHWKRVILDEAHVIRNHKTLRSECVAKLLTDKRWALTGTPIHNTVKDIFPMMRFLALRPFHDSKHFNKWIANNDAAGTARLHCVMECVMLRRTKEALVEAGLMPELPLKSKDKVAIVLVPEERLVYDKVMIYSRTLFIQFLHQRSEKEKEAAFGPGYMRNDNFNTYQLSNAQKNFLDRRGTISRHHILTLILRLRQICCHPALMRNMLEQEDFEEGGVDDLTAEGLDEANKELLDDLNEFDECGDEIGVDETVVSRRILTKTNPVFQDDAMSAKMIAVLERVQEIIKKGEKVLVVSDWVKYLVLIGKQLDKIPDATYEFYTGSTPYDERDDIVRKFNSTNETMVLLLSLRAGGQGLNLKGANHVILVDVHWNPQLEIQAQDRVYRIGQQRNVFIHKFVCQDTIEERIVALQDIKLRIAAAVLTGSKHEVRRLELAEMCSLFNL